MPSKIKIEQFYFKAPTGRYDELFSAVPFLSGATTIKFISKHRTMIADLEKNTLTCSKRIHASPSFLNCTVGMGAVVITLPNNLKSIIDELTPKPNKVAPKAAHTFLKAC